MSRVKSEYRTTSRDVYNRFCLAYPDIKLSFEDWKKIIYTYSHVVRDYILESGDIAKVPFGIGAFAIAKKKVKKHKTDPWGREWINLAVDWKKTRELGKKTYHLNTHSDGYSYRWKWFIGTARFYLSSIWSFRPYRESSRKLAQFLKNPTKKYTEIYNEWK